MKILLILLLVLFSATVVYAGWATLNGFDANTGRNDQIEKGTDANPIYISFVS
jgi:hypothetical protein